MTIYYWKGLIGDFPTEINETIKQLLAGEYRNLRLEKLHGYDVWSIRDSKAGRILFTTHENAGDHYLLFLEHLPNHEYERSKFLKSGVLEQYKHKHAAQADAAIDSGELKWFEHDNLDIQLSPDNASQQLQALHQHRKKLIQYNVDQSRVIEGGFERTLISGAAGSGKTCIAIGKMIQHIIQAPDERVIYVTQSDRLVDDMVNQWCSSAEVPDDLKDPAALIKPLHNRCNVSFVSFDQLFKDRKSKKSTADMNTFIERMQTKKSDILTIRKKMGLKDNAELTPVLRKIYQEFLLISAFETKGDYLNKFKDESLFADDMKAIVYGFFESHMDFLDKAGMVDPRFNVAQPLATADYVVVDETQDLSPKQWQALCQLTEKQNDLFLIDTNQSLSRAASIRRLLEWTLTKDGKALNHIVLTQNYRCGAAIAHAANGVLLIKNLLNSGVCDANEYAKMEIDPAAARGTARIIAHDNVAQMTEMHRLVQRADTAVIVMTADEKAAARDVFNTQLTFSIDEVKGCEFNTVIIHQPFDSKIFTEINRALPDATASCSLRTNRSKDRTDKSGQHYNEALHRMFTAITRAQKNVVIVQNREYHNAKIMGILTDAMTMTDANDEIFEADSDEATTNQAWAERALALYRDPATREQAIDIAHMRLKLSPSLTHQEIERALAQLCGKAEADAPTNAKQAPAKQPQARSKSNGGNRNKRGGKSKAQRQKEAQLRRQQQNERIQAVMAKVNNDPLQAVDIFLVDEDLTTLNYFVAKHKVDPLKCYAHFLENNDLQASKRVMAFFDMTTQDAFEIATDIGNANAIDSLALEPELDAEQVITVLCKHNLTTKLFDLLQREKSDELNNFTLFLAAKRDNAVIIESLQQLCPNIDAMEVIYGAAEGKNAELLEAQFRKQNLTFDISFIAKTFRMGRKDCLSMLIRTLAQDKMHEVVIALIKLNQHSFIQKMLQNQHFEHHRNTILDAIVVAHTSVPQSRERTRQLFCSLIVVSDRRYTPSLSAALGRHADLDLLAILGSHEELYVLPIVYGAISVNHDQLVRNIFTRKVYPDDSDSNLDTTPNSIKQLRRQLVIQQESLDIALMPTLLLCAKYKRKDLLIEFLKRYEINIPLGIFTSAMCHMPEYRDEIRDAFLKYQSANLEELLRNDLLIAIGQQQMHAIAPIVESYSKYGYEISETARSSLVSLIVKSRLFHQTEVIVHRMKLTYEYYIESIIDAEDRVLFQALYNHPDTTTEIKMQLKHCCEMIATDDNSSDTTKRFLRGILEHLDSSTEDRIIFNELEGSSAELPITTAKPGCDYAIDALHALLSMRGPSSPTIWQSVEHFARPAESPNPVTLGGIIAKAGSQELTSDRCRELCVIAAKVASLQIPAEIHNLELSQTQLMYVHAYNGNLEKMNETMNKTMNEFNDSASSRIDAAPLLAAVILAANSSDNKELIYQFADAHPPLIEMLIGVAIYMKKSELVSQLLSTQNEPSRLICYTILCAIYLDRPRELFDLIKQDIIDLNIVREICTLYDNHDFADMLLFKLTDCGDPYYSIDYIINADVDSAKPTLNNINHIFYYAAYFGHEKCLDELLDKRLSKDAPVEDYLQLASIGAREGGHLEIRRKMLVELMRVRSANKPAAIAASSLSPSLFSQNRSDDCAASESDSLKETINSFSGKRP